MLLPYENGKQPPDTQVLKVPANTQPVSCKIATASCLGAGSNGRTYSSGEYWPAVQAAPGADGQGPRRVGHRRRFDPNTGSSIVTLQFTGHGSDEFKRITEEEYNRGRVNAGQAGQLNATDQNTVATYAGHNAIVLDGELQETPYIDYTDSTLSLGIAGNAQITEPDADAAKSTALVLQSGSLPYTFTRLSQTEVSATLGKSSLHQAL